MQKFVVLTVQNQVADYGTRQPVSRQTIPAPVDGLAASVNLQKRVTMAYQQVRADAGWLWAMRTSRTPWSRASSVSIQFVSCQK